MSWLKKAWRWLKRNWEWIAGTVVLLFAAFFGATIIRDQKKRLIQQHKVKVLKAEREVARLEGKRDIIREREGDVEEEIKAIDADIEKLNEKIKNERDEVDRLSSKEKLEEFRKLRY